MDFIKTHMPCDDCGSSDALSLNADGSTKCFACGNFTPSNTPVTLNTPSDQKFNFIEGNVLPIPQRKLHEDICRRYDYRIASVNEKPCHVATYPTQTKIESDKRYVLKTSHLDVLEKLILSMGNIFFLMVERN